MQIVDVGETWPVTTSWWDADGDDAEPSAITLTIVAPDGTTTTKTKVDMTTPDVAPAVESHWDYALTVTAEGLWRITAVATIDGREVTQSFMFIAGAAVSSGGPFAPWASWGDVTALCESSSISAALAGIPNETREYLLDVATWILYSLDGSRFPGIGTATRRVCRQCARCREFAAGCCRCGIVSTLDLGPRWKVYAVWDVVVAGETLAASAYQLRDHRWLDRIDGDTWPSCSDLTDPDSFTISWAYGRRPPVGLVHACARFALEMAKGCADLECAFPERVTSINREGVTYVMLDPQRFLDEGRTGIYEVDLALIAAKKGRAALPGAASPLRGSQTHRVG